MRTSSLASGPTTAWPAPRRPSHAAPAILEDALSEDCRQSCHPSLFCEIQQQDLIVKAPVQFQKIQVNVVSAANRSCSTNLNTLLFVFVSVPNVFNSRCELVSRCKRIPKVVVNQIKQQSRCQDGLGKVLLEVERLRVQHQRRLQRTPRGERLL